MRKLDSKIMRAGERGVQIRREQGRQNEKRKAQKRRGGPENKMLAYM